MEQIPLNHEASDGDTNKQITGTMPPEVVQCLENARFVREPSIHFGFIGACSLLSISAEWTYHYNSPRES
jgi:hypothetical protein